MRTDATILLLIVVALLFVMTTESLADIIDKLIIFASGVAIGILLIKRTLTKGGDA